jgi:hypothetical protein
MLPRLLGNGETTRCPFPATASQGFARLFFPLLRPMPRRNGNPAISQQGFLDSRLTLQAIVQYFLLPALPETQ